MYTYMKLFRLEFPEKLISVRADTVTGLDESLQLLYNM